MPRIPGLRRFFRLPSAERDVHALVDDEIAFHVDMLAEQLAAEGHPPEAARREALRRFGNLDGVRRRCYEISLSHATTMRRHELLSSVWQDVVYAARGMRRARGFAVVVLLTLALGIGATTAMFSVVRGVLLRPLPFPDAERVVRLWPGNPKAVAERRAVSAKELEDWERELRGFEAVGAFSVIPMGHVYGEGGAEPAYARTSYVSRGFFPALGTPARLGRTLRAEEHVAGADRFVVVSDAFWRAQLGADPQVVGRGIRLDGKPFTVVGVMGPDFAFPDPGIAVWMPSSVMDPDDVALRGREVRWLSVVGRLRPGVTPEQGRVEVEALLQRLATRYPQTNAGWTTAVVEDVRDSIVGKVRRGLLLLLGAVGLVLLVVCANVASLLLVRATGRGREMAIRAALGAGRARVVRLLLTESLLLALAGGALGVLLAWWCTDALTMLASGLPRTHEIGVDGAALAFTLAVSLAAGIGFGLVPALHVARGDLHEDLKEGGRTAGGRGGRTRSLLVGAQVAGSLVLLVGAALLLKSFARLQGVELGFNPNHVLTARVTLGGERYEDEARQVRFFEDLIARVKALPGVRAAGAINWLPLGGQRSATRMIIEGEPPPAPGHEPGADVRAVDPGFFAAMEIPIVRGRGIEAGDRAGVPRSVVVSRSFAARYLAGRDPIGRRIHMEWGDTLVGTVVGVVGDIKHTGVDSVPEPTVYWALPQFPSNFMTLVVRTQDNPDRLANALLAQVRALDPEQPVADLKPFDEWLGGAVARRRFTLLLLGGFAGLALVLTVIGLYGTTAYGVVQRTRELGIRSALGARRVDLLWSVLRQAVQVVAIGAAVGCVLALALSRVLSSLLFEVSATDPVVFIAITLLLLVVGATAGLLPARKATRVDPMIAIRAE
jgi:predicted permease